MHTPGGNVQVGGFGGRGCCFQIQITIITIIPRTTCNPFNPKGGPALTANSINRLTQAGSDGCLLITGPAQQTAGLSPLSWPSLLSPLARFMDEHHGSRRSTAQRAAVVPQDIFCTDTSDSFIKTKETCLQHWLMLSMWLWLCCLVEKPFHSLVGCLSVIWRSPFLYNWCQGGACWRNSNLHRLLKWLLTHSLSCFCCSFPETFVVVVVLGTMLGCLVWTQWRGSKCIWPHKLREVQCCISPCSRCIDSGTPACNNQYWSSSTHPSLKNTIIHHSQRCTLLLRCVRYSFEGKYVQGREEAHWLSAPTVPAACCGASSAVSERCCCCIISNSL